MRRLTLCSIWDRAPGVRWLVVCLIVPLAAPGCRHESAIEFARGTKTLTVQIVQPRPRNIVRVIGQPSFIESYERTSIYPKPTAYIGKWIVDIGDKVKKSDVLATLFAPELVERLGTRKAAVVLDRRRITLAQEVVGVARADVEAAEARLAEAEAILDKFKAEVDRWNTEVNRLERQVARAVINPLVLIESTNQLKSSISALDKAKATIERVDAELLGSRARLEKAQVFVRVAEATYKVAECEERYAKAWVGYLTLSAPFPGVISARNANTFDFVQPTTGDPTAFYLSPDISPGGGAAPIYVVDRLDIVRIFLDIPERDANYVTIGTRASVHARAFRDTELPATVTRTSWALNMKSRTLRAEVDLANPDGQLLPGMYAYVKVLIERPNAQAVPRKALVHSGEQTFCWLHQSGKAVRTEVETGVSDDQWVEVTNRRPPVPPEAPGDSVPWTPIDGDEQVIVGDLPGLVEGALVDVGPATPAPKPRGDQHARDPGPDTHRLLSDARAPHTARPAMRLP